MLNGVNEGQSFELFVRLAHSRRVMLTSHVIFWLFLHFVIRFLWRKWQSWVYLNLQQAVTLNI